VSYRTFFLLVVGFQRGAQSLCWSLHFCPRLTIPFPVLVFSLPWGYFADSYGRKPVILLLSIALWIKFAYVQLICYFGGALSLKLTWLSALHTVFGGSVIVATALIYTIISDVIPEGER